MITGPQSISYPSSAHLISHDSNSLHRHATFHSQHEEVDHAEVKEREMNHEHVHLTTELQESSTRAADHPHDPSIISKRGIKRVVEEGHKALVPALLTDERLLKHVCALKDLGTGNYETVKHTRS